MKPQDFSDNAPGRLIRQGSEPAAYWAFVPNPLPPRLDFDHDLVRLLSEADRAVGELAGLGRALDNPEILIQPLIRREAVLSSAIEGTQTEIAGLYAYEAGQLSPPGIEAQAPDDDAQEVLNYVRALEYGIERVKTLPVSLRLMRELHAKLMTGVRGDSATPGEFRTRQNWIGRPGSVLNDASYVPPPVSEMNMALADLELYLHMANDPYPPLVRLAFVHYQFEAIHPFVDGNGRIGRLLLSLLLVEWGLLPLPLLYLSAFFERNRSAYYDGLAAVTHSGAWREWVLYFLSGVREQSRDAVQRLRALQDLLARWKTELQRSKSTPTMIHIVDMLASEPQMTAGLVAGRFGVTYQTALNALRRLEKMGIVKELTGMQRGQIFCATDVIRIFT